MIKFTNNVKTELIETIDATQTSFDVNDTSKFPFLGPEDYTYCTIVDPLNQPYLEICRVTAISGNRLTVQRGIEGTTAKPFGDGCTVELRMTAELLTRAIREIPKDEVDGNITLIRLKRDDADGFDPALNPEAIEVGELAYNTTNGDLWSKTDGGEIIKLGGPSFIPDDAPYGGISIYGRRNGQWTPIPFNATFVSDTMPTATDPVTGNSVPMVTGVLWYDSGTTGELYVWDGYQWVSMTGGGSDGEVSDNVVTDSVDLLDRDKALARVVDTDGNGTWRPIYTADIVTEGSAPMFRNDRGQFSRADEAVISSQKEANWYLLDRIDTEVEELWAAIQGLAPLPKREPIYAEQAPTEYPSEPPEPLEVDDQWYEVTDPDFDYDNPDPEGLDLYIWEKVEGDFEWVLFEEEVPDGVVIIKGEAPDKEEDGVGNGSLWFDNSEDVMQLYIWHTDSDAWIPVAPPTTLEGRVATGEATQAAIIAQIQESLQVQSDILLKVGELEVSKGSVARYKVMGTEFAVASRAGELYVSSPDASQVVNISLAILDLDDNPTKPCHEDDIIEFDWADGGVVRYQVVSGDSQALVVTYLSGTHTFEADQELETYVYPQNKGSASIDYVDAQDDLKLDKSGGILDGALHFQRGSKDFPQLRITPNNGTNYSTSIYAMHDAELRLRSSHTDNEGDHVGSHIIISANEGAPSTKIYHVPEPTQSHMAASKGYVDQQTGAGISTKLWKYCEGKDRSELRANEFTVNFVDGDKDKIEIYMYPYINGKWWAPAINTNYTHQIGETYCTISDHSGACAIGFKGLKWWFIQQAYDSNGTKRWHNALQGNYYKLAYPDSYRLKDQHWYNLNFPSPFPLVNFPEELHTGEVGAFGIEPEEAPVPPDAIDMGEVLP